MLHRLIYTRLKRAGFTFFLLFCASLYGSFTAVADDEVGVAVINNTNRIIGGSESSSGQFPYIAALVRNNTSFLSDRQFCGASIIADKWLLTAAHCMYDRFGSRITSDSFKVAVGFTNLRTEQPEELTVSNYYLHPQYDHNDLLALNDIALIELANNQAQPAVGLYEADGSALAGFNATVMGWGATDYSDPTAPVYPNELRHAVLPIVSRDVCNAPVSYQGTIATTQVCAGFPAGGVDSCVGDSGGPLVTSIDGRLAQVGIVSFGAGCAEPFFYGVYTNIGAYVDWIDDYVQISRVGTPVAFAGSGGFNGGSAGGATSNPSTGGAAWVLLWLLAGVAYYRRS